MKQKQLLLALAMLTLAACATHPSPAGLSGTYGGTLPCADCEGIDTLLTLGEDGHFSLKRIYLKSGGDTIPPDVGTWQYRGNVIELFPLDKVPGERYCYGVRPDGSLEPWDIECQPMDSSEVLMPVK